MNYSNFCFQIYYYYLKSYSNIQNIDSNDRSKDLISEIKIVNE